jgi:serine/threonine-protein kinase
MALSPDGRRLVYAADDAGETHLYLRELDSFGVRKLPGTQAARYPFFSPDGEWIGYFAEGQLLKVAFDQGPPSPLCEAEPLRGAAWSPNGWIYFSQITRGTVTDETPSPAAAPSDLAIQGVSYRLLRVPETGGTPEPVISSQPEAEDGGHRFPSPLPDGRGLITRASGGVIALLSFDTGEWTSLGPGEQARYVEPGFLAIHAGRGQIRVAPFDLETQRLEGEPRPIVDGIYRSPNGGGAFFAVSQRGDLVYVPGGYDRTLERVDRSGRSAPLISDVRGFRLPRLSPDARALAAIVDPRPSELWTYDLERGSQNRLFRDGHNLVPVWSPDGASIAWTSNGDILRIPADGSGATEPMLARPGPQYVTDWSPDGRYLVYNHEVRSSSDIWLLPLGEEPRPLVSTAADEQHARISPDGKWFVYESNETGRFEVYVRSFPDGSNQRTVSVGGGRHPAWASGGRELFFHDESGMYVVGVRTDPAFGAASPHHLFDWPHGLVHDFDVAPDGDWFAMVRSDPETSPDHFRVVLNWASELEEKLRPAP